MRTTKSQLESAVKRYAELTGKNYILRQRDSRVGGYGVCVVYPERGYSQGNDIIAGSANEVYNELWAAIRAIEEYQQAQAEQPQFLIRAIDGMVQGVYSIGATPVTCLVIDEDEICATNQDNPNWKEMSHADVVRRGITEGMKNDEFTFHTSTNIKEFTAEAICKAWYPEHEQPNTD